MAASSGGLLPRRIAYIDGLRAAAVLGVVVFHAANWSSKPVTGPLRPLLTEGAHGVDLFFVLSGFCLSYPVLRALHTKGSAVFDVVGYMARRVVRIIPPYWLAIIVLYLALLWVHVRLHVPDTLLVTRLGWFDFVKQAVFADRRTELLNPSFWTLAIEWRWYFLFPLALVLWIRSTRAFIFAVVWCGLIAAMTRSGGLDFPVLPPFLLGIVAAQMDLEERKIGRISLLLCILSACVAWYMEPLYELRPFLQLQPGWQLAAFFLVLAAGSLPVLRAALSFRPLVWTGIASYSIYLVHEPIIATLEQNTAILPAIAAVCAVAGGFAFWAIFERPFMTRPLKGILVSKLSTYLGAFVAWIGVPGSIALSARPGPAPQVSPVLASITSAGGPIQDVWQPPAATVSDDA